MVSGSGERGLGGSANPPVDVSRLHGETARLALRQYRPDDADGVAAVYATAESVRFVPFPVLVGEPLGRAITTRTAPAFEKDDDKLFFVAVDTASGAMIGEFGIFLRSVENGTAEFGYGIHPDWSRRGFATEGSRAIMALAFQTLGVRRLIAELDARNAASVAVLTKLGMRREGHFVEGARVKGELVDDVIYAMLAHEWPGTSGVSWAIA